VRINADREHFLDWDKPINQQSPQVREAIAPILREFGLEGENLDYLAGKHVLNRMSETLANGASSSPVVSQRLRDAGIPGIKYLDQGSREPWGIQTAGTIVKTFKTETEARSYLKEM